MTERAAGLAEAAMIAEGRGGPPCAFAVMVLGSGGRGESLLKPDQDNAIVYAHGDPDGPEDRWFAAFGERMCAILDEATIPLCQGGIMAKNAEWRGSIATWRDRVANWVASANPRNLLNVDIFFDLMPVFGEKRLAADIFAYAYDIGSQNPIFAKLLGVKLEQISNPFGFLGRLNTDGGWLDLKLYALFPIVTAARTLAIRNNIPVQATRERLQRLAARGRGNANLLLDLIKDHGYCQSLMLAQQARAILCGEKLGNTVHVDKLPAKDQARLKEALKRIQLVPDAVRDMMF